MSSQQVQAEIRRNPSLLEINSHVYQKKRTKTLTIFLFIEDLGLRCLHLPVSMLKKRLRSKVHRKEFTKILDLKILALVFLVIKIIVS